MVRCECTTPLGSRVVPDVKATMAVSSGSTSTGDGSGSASSKAPNGVAVTGSDVADGAVPRPHLRPDPKRCVAHLGETLGDHAAQGRVGPPSAVAVALGEFGRDGSTRPPLGRCHVAAFLGPSLLGLLCRPARTV